jgi:dihydroorotase
MTKRYLIKNGRVIDPANKTDDILDIIVSGGKIEKIGKSLAAEKAEVIDAKGMIVAPGLIDMHTHLREPGREDKETIKSGTRAAVKGGFTTVLAMPNTEPPADTADRVKSLKAIIAKDAVCEVLIVGAITKDRAGIELADLKGLKKEGVLAISDDGSPVDGASLMENALKAAKKEGMLILSHSEIRELSAKGVINKGFISTKMGLKGIPREAEHEGVRRDIELAKRSDAAIHIAHVSCKESVDIIRKAKKYGISVTAETCPHYFSLTEDCCVTYDTNMKMNPPLRTKDDVDAIKKALADGTIDAISTDHAPHTDSEKDVEFDYAPFGIIGLETALSIAVMELIETKVLSWNELITRMSTMPARILNINKGSIKEGVAADIVVIDPAAEYLYTKDLVVSKSKNSPYLNWKLKARVKCVFAGGEPAVRDGAISDK